MGAGDVLTEIQRTDAKMQPLTEDMGHEGDAEASDHDDVEMGDGPDCAGDGARPPMQTGPDPAQSSLWSITT